jgi:Tol biopolymer transport system component
MRKPLTRCAALVAILGLTLAAAPAGAQYFGRNKVQFKTFDFEVLKTEHFDIHFYPEERDAAGQVALMAERWYVRLSQVLGHTLDSRQPIVLYASHADFEQTNVIQGAIGEGTGGVTEGLKRRVVLPLAGTLAETDHVLGHELVHAFQYDMAARPSEQPGLRALDRLPLWFIEGMAEYLSIGPVDTHTAMWIRDASREEELPAIGRLDDPRLFPYRWGQALWAYVAGRWGDDAVRRTFARALEIGNAADAIVEVAGLTEKELSAEWHAAIRGHHDPIREAARPASTFGRRLTAEEGREAAVNVSPALSPDGSRVVFLSERGLLSVDLYVADVETGRIIRRLVHTAVDPHYSSLQFIGSAGSWAPDSREFVFGAIRQGHPVLAFLEVDSGRITREIPFPTLGEIVNPSWAPDGRAVVFSATRGGWSDLFIYDLEKQALRQVTQDAYADLQPAWSGDGRRVAFVTDRFSTDLPTLDPGAYGLALLDPATGGIEPLRTFDRGKSINPQWAADGRRLYFLSDRSGITNVYLKNVETGEVSQVTDLDAGASGITALSPALTVALDANRLAFSAYERGRLDIYVTDRAEVLAGGPVIEPSTERWAGALPPERRATTTLVSMLEDATTGLPADPGQTAPYSSGLSLDFVGQPYVSAGVSSFGPTLGGGISFMWSDMLGNHNLFATIDANTYGLGVSDLAKNTGGVLAYQNLTRRWNWGVAVEQSPYLAGGFISGLTSVDGQTAFVDQTIIQRQTYRSANGMVAYPFSQTFRLEFGGGFNHLSYEEQVRTTLTSVQTGRQISDETVTNDLVDPLNFGTAMVAAVSDRSVFGATSPVAGERSRFELSPTFGAVSFTSATADYRRYFAPASFYTIAGRALHVGRYGSGAEDSRLLPLFIGYPQIVRGYGIGSFEASECAVGPAGDCDVFDRLLGSRMLVGNLEFRFPLLRPFGIRSGMYGPLPTEVAFFVDGGVAWNRNDRPALFGGERDGVSSAGITFRFNLFNFAVAQADLARPFQRPGRGWVWGFSLTPGF